MLNAAAQDGVYLNFSEDDDRWHVGYTGTLHGVDRYGIKRIKGIGSGYRTSDESVEAQRRLGDVKAGGTAAAPGMSVHNLGTAVDFQFSDDDAIAAKQVEWLHNEGWKYGFVPYSPEGKEEPNYNLTINDKEVWHFDWRPDWVEKNRERFN